MGDDDEDDDSDGSDGKHGWHNPRAGDEMKDHQARRKDKHQEVDENDSDESEELPSHRGKSKRKKNKDAPEEVSSKFPISRRRRLREATKAEAKQLIWDPRFNPAVAKTNAPKGAYDFLNKYRDDEMDALKTAITRISEKSKKKNGQVVRNEAVEREKQALRLELTRMQNQKANRERKKKAEELMKEEKKKEREAVEKGKMPFFLKRGEQKKRLLEERERSMSGKAKRKSTERREKKLAAREKKKMPLGRRGVDL